MPNQGPDPLPQAPRTRRPQNLLPRVLRSLFLLPAWLGFAWPLSALLSTPQAGSGGQDLGGTLVALIGVVIAYLGLSWLDRRAPRR